MQLRQESARHATAQVQAVHILADEVGQLAAVHQGHQYLHRRTEEPLAQQVFRGPLTLGQPLTLGIAPLIAVTCHKRCSIICLSW